MKDRDLRGKVRSRQSLRFPQKNSGSNNNNNNYNNNKNNNNKGKQCELMDVQSIFCDVLKYANNGMVLTELPLEGWKTNALHLFFMRNARRVQETCVTSDRLPGVGGKIENCIKNKGNVSHFDKLWNFIQ